MDVRRSPRLPQELRQRIEAEDRTASLSGAESSGNGSARESLDVKQGQLKRLREIVDLDVIRKANLSVFRSHVGRGAGILR